MPRTLLAFLILLIVFPVKYSCAQLNDDNMEIKGRVFDETCEPIIGAVVQIFRDSINMGGAATDIDGNFSIRPIYCDGQSNFTMRVSNYSYYTVTLKIDLDGPVSFYDVQMQINPNPEEPIIMCRGGYLPRFSAPQSNQIETKWEMSDIIICPVRVVYYIDPPGITTITGEQIDKMAR